ncbi:MAG: (Fe-S)-binding protein [Gemmataceae bacterium]
MSTPPVTARSPLPLADAGLGRNIDYEVFMDCVHCGLCLGSCPTYVETGNENDSPRGRIYLWRAVTDGRAPLTPEVQKHLDLCLECLACQTACPSGVQYGQIISSYKKDMAKQGHVAPRLNFVQRWMLFHLTPYASRMRWALAPLYLAQRLGLRGLIDRLGLLPASLRACRRSCCGCTGTTDDCPKVLPAEGRGSARGVVCRMRRRRFLPAIDDRDRPRPAKERLRGGFRPPGCGALHYHTGQVAPAQKLAADNAAAFGKRLDEMDAIITNAGGCGPVLKEYGHLLEGTAHDEDGGRFAHKVKDIHEFLVELGPVPPTHPLPITAAYHDACGLSHGQKIRTQPRQLLALIPELKLVPLAESEHCCGAAGSYNLTQPEMSAELGARKAKNVLATGARALFTGNVGCLLQIARHLREQHAHFWVAHPVDALWASYSGELPDELKGK